MIEARHVGRYFWSKVLNLVLTFSPIHTPQNTVLENLVAAEKAAEELRKKLGFAISEYMNQLKNESSMSSLVLDVSKISILKVTYLHIGN